MNRRVIRMVHVAGLAGVVLGFAWLHAHRLAPVSYPLWGSFRLSWSMVILGLLVASSYGLGLPELAVRRSEVILTSMGAFAVSALGVSLSQLALGSQLLPRSVLLLTAVVVPVWSLIVWNLDGDVRHREQSRDRVLLIAREQADVAALQADLAAQPEHPAVVVGHLDLSSAMGDGTDAPLLLEAEKVRPTVIVFDSHAQSTPRIVDQAVALHQTGVRFRTLSLFYEHWLGKLPVGDLQRVALLFDIGEVHRVRYTRLKRVIDLVCAVTGLTALLPAMALVATLNVFLNPGPLFFRQVRVGKGGEPFEILKFRSMRPVPEGAVHTWTADRDDRVGAFGRFLRRSHLDELPQVLNILRGELSIVGPRPEQLAYVEELRTKLPFYDVRHLVRPGLTGWAQVKFGYAASERDALEKLQYDIFYLRRQSIGLDLRILVRTLRAVARGIGR